MKLFFRNYHLRMAIVIVSFILVFVITPIIWCTDVFDLSDVAKVTLTLSVLAFFSGAFYEKIRFTENKTKSNLLITKKKFPVEFERAEELWENLHSNYNKGNINFFYKPKKGDEYQTPPLTETYDIFLSSWNEMIDQKKSGQFVKWTFVNNENHSIILVKFSRNDKIKLDPKSQSVVYSKLKEKNIKICKIAKGAKGEKIYGKY